MNGLLTFGVPLVVAGLIFVALAAVFYVAGTRVLAYARKRRGRAAANPVHPEQT